MTTLWHENRVCLIPALKVCKSWTSVGSMCFCVSQLCKMYNIFSSLFLYVYTVCVCPSRTPRPPVWPSAASSPLMPGGGVSSRCGGRGAKSSLSPWGFSPLSPFAQRQGHWVEPHTVNICVHVFPRSPLLHLTLVHLPAVPVQLSPLWLTFPTSTFRYTFILPAVSLYFPLFPPQLQLIFDILSWMRLSHEDLLFWIRGWILFCGLFASLLCVFLALCPDLK